VLTVEHRNAAVDEHRSDEMPKAVQAQVVEAERGAHVRARRFCLDGAEEQRVVDESYPIIRACSLWRRRCWPSNPTGASSRASRGSDCQKGVKSKRSQVTSL
jgi:hypothetical protein